MSTTPTILVGCSNKIVWIRVEGKGSFVNSAGMKEFAKEMINRGHREFVIDLNNCPVMDSTFMGTMAGIALRLRELGQGRLHVINLNERNNDLLRNLGLDQLFAIDLCPIEESSPAQQPLDAASADKTSRAQTMLEAHENLVDADQQNLLKFKDVIDYLKQDLHRAE